MGGKAKLLRTTVGALALASAAAVAAPAAAQSGGPVKSMYGNIRPFYGNIRPFYGNIRPFYGNIRPFWGNIRPFWGNTSAFYGDLKGFWAVDNPVVGAGAPPYAQVGDFWAAAGGSWDQIWTAWDGLNPTTATALDYQPVAGQLQGLVDTSRSFWGASVQAKTGKGFDEGFAQPLLAKYGIDLKDPKSLASLDQTERALFFLDWYDGLMAYAGTDRVDHWMKTVNWSPSLTKTQGYGVGTTIGILDQTFVGDQALSGSVLKAEGVSTFTDGHGAAVASLIIAPHDGQGVMGMAPNAKVYAYSPFDSTGTASWSAVTTGVQKLKASGASVVNMSLGVPGMTFDPGWNNVFANLGTTLILKNTVFVVAAGNEGVSQTRNVPWSPLNPNLIIVGSVDLEGNISSFSNRPGNACLTTLGLLCLGGGYLKDHFIVAPGEMIMVDDGKGGVTRQSGTSLAAPLVSGAIALLHERWPWLAEHPGETVSIILNSAKDLGAPGVDPVYGHGLLDVTASQSPLDFNRLTWFTVENGVKKQVTSTTVLNTYKAEQTKTWEAKGAFFYAFEPLSLLVSRDFAIPLSSKLVGQNVTTLQGAREQFQAYLLARMDGWAASRSGFAGGEANGFFPSSTRMTSPWGGDLVVSFAPRQGRNGFRDEGPAYQSAMRFEGERSSFTVGFGDGAPALGLQPGFRQAADYDGDTGGANPLAGLASGGAYAGWSYALTDRLELSGNFLTRDEARDPQASPALGVPGNGAERYAAGATQLALSWKPSDKLTLMSGYTRLTEASGLLGVQSLDANDLKHGSTTDGWNLGVAWTPTSKLSFAFAGTLGRTRPADDGQSLRVAGHGLTTSAFEAAVTRSDLIAGGDRLRLTLSQPLHVESGRLAYDVVQVIDRQTGEIGIARESFAVSDQRRVAAELFYGAPVQAGDAEVSLFGRVEAGATGPADASWFSGARYRINF